METENRDQSQEPLSQPHVLQVCNGNLKNAIASTVINMKELSKKISEPFGREDQRKRTTTSGVVKKQQTGKGGQE